MGIEKLKAKLIRINTNLIEECEQKVIKSAWKSQAIGSITRVKIEPLYEWLGKVNSFSNQLGTAAKPWKELLNSTDSKENSLVHVQKILGTLKAIKFELENDHLETFEQIIKSETLADLIDQSEYLLKKNYFLAAGVIGRAVLEEHLRVLCNSQDLEIAKKHPTLNDYNQVLYKSNYYNKIKMKSIDTLISIGNDAAHNKEGLNKKDIEKLITELPGVIESTRIF